MNLWHEAWDDGKLITVLRDSFMLFSFHFVHHFGNEDTYLQVNFHAGEKYPLATKDIWKKNSLQINSNLASYFTSPASTG